jgi:hypothetical protein
MPVVITDFTNRVWALEQPTDGYVHVGFTGEGGPRLLDVLEFIRARQKQFDQFVEKKNTREAKLNAKRPRKRAAVQSRDLFISKDRGTSSSRTE